MRTGGPVTVGWATVIVLVVGSGAREHAFVHSFAADPAVQEVHAAPGNPGMGRQATLHPVQVTDPQAVAELARRIGADLVVVGPEAPLIAGVADAVRDRGIACFGPGAAAAQLEGSKAFAKTIMAEAQVPTAMARLCTTLDEVSAAMDAFGAPYVIKDDGLAGGKGVVVTDSRDTALEHARSCLAKPDGAVLVEEHLAGPEISLFCVTDGTTVVPLTPAQDYKRLQDGDQGPNTGGMGAYSPLPWAPADLTEQVLTRVAQPVIEVLAHRGTPFSGLLYCGVMLTARGLRVIEFNARFGDPETQVVLARLKSSLGTLLMASAQGTLDTLPDLRWSPDAAVTVVIASDGYPTEPRSGDPITGLDEAAALDGVHILHAGTACQGETVVSAGGRVLSVVGVGPDQAAARERAYAGVAAIGLAGGQARTDIATERGPGYVPGRG